MSEYLVEDHVNLFADLTSLVFGFGIFQANAYFKFQQWQGNTHKRVANAKKVGACRNQSLLT